MSNGQKSSTILDEVIDNALGGLDWLKSVLLGQFAPEKELSALVAELLLNFVPGVVILTSARDAVAITIRLANHPEKRDDIMEWIFLCACLIVIALPVVMAAGGAVFAGVGAVVAGVAGTELGAVLKALICLLMVPVRTLSTTLLFLQKFMKGDLVKFLALVKFVEFQAAILNTLKATTDKLIYICRGVRERLQKFDYFDDVKQAITTLVEWEAKFYAVQTSAMKNIPKALVELDVRLKALLVQVGLKDAHTVVTGIKAPAPAAAPLATQYVYSPVGQHLREPALRPPASAPKASSRATSSAPKDAARSPGTHGTAPKANAEPVPKVEDGPNVKRQDTAEPDQVGHAPKKPPKFRLTKRMSPRYEGEELGHYWGTKVKYCTEAERSVHRLVVLDGKLHSADGALFDTAQATLTVDGQAGRAIYVMDPDGAIYAMNAHKVGGFHHSSFLAGQRVAAAGEIVVTEGVPTLVNRSSGHYFPDEVHLQQFLDQLTELGVGLDKTDVLRGIPGGH